ncbi:hypothetical protein OXV70_12030 [Bacteroides ovatus]|nr:hypothetical protein [Bacteroides ovatus]
MARKKNTEAPVTEEVKTQDPTVTSETPVISNEESENKSKTLLKLQIPPLSKSLLKNLKKKTKQKKKMKYQNS